MQFHIGGEFASNPSIVVMTHGQESIKWESPTYNRKDLEDPKNFFANLNRYIAHQSQSNQQAMWDIMVGIKRALDDISETTMLHKKIRKSVKDFYELLDFDALRQHVSIHGRVTVPPNLLDDYSSIDRELTKRTTYLRDDYYDLVILSNLIKPMIPVFGEYMRRITQEVSGVFKEHYAFFLLTASKIVQLPAFERLKDYIEAVVENEKDNPSGVDIRRNSAILGGLGTEELPDWLLSSVLVRKVVIHEDNINASIVAGVYHQTIASIKQLDKKFKGRINDKKAPYTNKSEEDNISIAENYKIKQEIPDGILRVLSKYSEEMFDMAGRVDPTFDPEKVKICFEQANANQLFRTSNHHFTFAQWTLSKAISPRAIPSLNKPALIKAIAVTQGLLWHWGFHELAVLMLAETTGQISQAANASTSQLKKSYVDQLVPMYPHYQRVSPSQHTERKVNVACNAIGLIQGELIQTDWIVQGPKELCQEGHLPQPGQIHYISAEIKQHLAELIIKVQSLKNDSVQAEL